MNSKTVKNVSYALAFLMLCTLLNSFYFFVVMLKLNALKWLSFNACSLAIIIYLVCFILFQLTKKEHLLAIPLLPLYYYGTMGLFVMPWDATNAFAQVTHIIITINLFWILYMLLKEQKFEPIGKGLLTGVIIFVPIFAFIQSFTQLHSEEFLKALQSM